MIAKANVKATETNATSKIARSSAHLADLHEMATGVLKVAQTRQPEVNAHALKV
jgi:hypothetical protein